MPSLLRDLGWAATGFNDEPWSPEEHRVLLICGNLNWYPRLRKQLRTMRRPEDSVVVLWQMEPLPPPSASGVAWPFLSMREVAKIVLRDRRATDVYTNYFRIRQFARWGLPDLLVTSTRGRVDFLKERGIQAHYLPLGYTPNLGTDLGMTRDIGALFLGDLRIPRRRRMIARLRRKGVDVVCCGDWSNPLYWGENRTRLLNRSKVFLNIQRFPGEFCGMRFALGMGNKSLVISEPVYDSTPFESGRHYVTASVGEMPEAIKYYLSHEEAREKIVNEAFKFATEEATLRHSVNRLGELIAKNLKR